MVRIISHILSALAALSFCVLACAQTPLRRACGNVLISAVQLYEDGETEKAAAMFESILKKDPDDDAAHYYLALCHIGGNSMEEAELHLTRAVELDSANYWYRQRLAMVLSLTGRNAEAAETYESMLRDFPKKMDSFYALVDLYVNLDRADDALAVLDRIETLNGVSESTVISRSQIMGMQGMNAGIRDYLEKMDPELESPQIKTILGDICLGQYDFENAMRYYEGALSIAPDFPRATLGAMEVYRLSMRYQPFFELAERFVSDRETDPQMRCQYMRSLLQQIHPRMLRECGPQLDSLVSTCVRSCPGNAEAALIDCLLPYIRDSKEELSDRAHGYMSAYPDEDEFMQLAVYADYALGRYASVLAMMQTKYERALAKGDREAAVDALSSMGDLYWQTGDARRAFRTYEEVLRTDPDNAMVLNNYAYFLSEEGRKLRKAFRMSARAIEKEPDNATYLDTYGWILHLLRRDAEALPVFKKAMIYGGKDSEVILRHYAEVLEANGKKDLAEMYRKQADAKENGK